MLVNATVSLVVGKDIQHADKVSKQDGTQRGGHTLDSGSIELEVCHEMDRKWASRKEDGEVEASFCNGGPYISTIQGAMFEPFEPNGVQVRY